ncbi:F-box only protein 6-like [Neocloeon triangulifer]|uniref:F-box only protein 6-like n=1 Tax=Neocloeon triangulifer TaxID=2078957 RepID=UPI00286F501B|nr:F-box only protein 6-like [Neocloeon triangulifer]
MKKKVELPIEVQELIFLQLNDSNALLRCRRVCKSWKDTIDRLLAVERILIPRLINYKEHYELLDSKLRIETKRVLCENLLRNQFFKPAPPKYYNPLEMIRRGNVKENYPVLHWETGGYFKAEKLHDEGIPKFELCRFGFKLKKELTVIASWGSGSIHSQQINLEELKISGDFMDQIQPVIIFELWVGTSSVFGSCTSLHANLRNKKYSTPILSKYILIKTPSQGTGAWRKVIFTMKNYGPGVRWISFSRCGQESGEIRDPEESNMYSGTKFPLNKLYLDLLQYF